MDKGFRSHLLSDRPAQCIQLGSVGGKQGASNIKPLVIPSNLTTETLLGSSLLLFVLQTNLTLPLSLWQTRTDGAGEQCSEALTNSRSLSGVNVSLGLSSV